MGDLLLLGLRLRHSLLIGLCLLLRLLLLLHGLLRLLLGGRFSLLLFSLLLCGGLGLILLLPLLDLDGRRLVVIVVATSNKGQSGRADTCAGAGSQQRAP